MINYSFSNGRAVVFSTSTNKYFLSGVCNWINHCQWNDRFEKSTNNRTSRIHDPLYMYNIYIYKIYIIYIYIYTHVCKSMKAIVSSWCMHHVGWKLRRSLEHDDESISVQPCVWTTGRGLARFFFSET